MSLGMFVLLKRIMTRAMMARRPPLTRIKAIKLSSHQVTMPESKSTLIPRCCFVEDSDRVTMSVLRAVSQRTTVDRSLAWG